LKFIPHSFSRADLSVAYVAGPGELRSHEATEEIDKAWESHVLNCREYGLTIFDGSLFRLNRYALKEGKMLLELGDTTFREYVGTSTSDFYSIYPDVWVADPLAVCIALVTDDHKILVEKRTTLTRYRAPFHVIGGFMEREKDFCHGRPDPFLAITREVKEELGLRLSPEDPVALGLVRNLWVRHPEIVFFCRIKGPFENVKEIVAQSATDDEIDQLQVAEGTSDGLASFLKIHHVFFTGSGMACLLLYGRRMFGEDWYKSLFRELTGR
jgi:8-oxo-dGTP pyrophosphatase MutT (NUDIX family)